MDGLEVTEAQTKYVRALQRKVHLPDRMLDSHCIQRFGKPYARLDRRQASSLIDEMIGWEALPANLQRAKGQADLPGLAP